MNLELLNHKDSIEKAKAYYESQGYLTFDYKSHELFDFLAFKDVGYTEKINVQVYTTKERMHKLENESACRNVGVECVSYRSDTKEEDFVPSNRMIFPLSS